MNRRSFLRNTGLLGACATGFGRFAYARQESIVEVGALRFTTPPCLQAAGEGRVTVAIGVSGCSTAWVEYGETEELGQVETGSRHGLKPLEEVAHNVELRELKPGRRYFYRVCARPIDFRGPYDIRRGPVIHTGTHSLRGFDPEAGEARFVVLNDLHNNAPVIKRLSDRVAALPTDFLVLNGDIANEVDREKDIPSQYIAPGDQPLGVEVPLVFARGNHDVRGLAARSLSKYVRTPGGRFYYSFRHGPLAGLVLDAGEDKPDSDPVYAGLGDFVAYRREQTKWLEAELNKPEVRSAAFRVVFCHVPCVWEGRKVFRDEDDPRREWHRLFLAGKIAAVVSGHTHEASCQLPGAGRPYAQLTGGGALPRNATLIRGEVTRERLLLSITDLEGREIHRWLTKEI